MNLKEGSLIVFAMENGIKGTGVICGRINDLWIVRLTEDNRTPFDREGYPYSCVALSASVMVPDVIGEAKKLQDEVDRKAKFQQAIDNCRTHFAVLGKFCLGCSVLKTEGPRSYTDPAPIVNGKCSKCHLTPYKVKHVSSYSI